MRFRLLTAAAVSALLLAPVVMAQTTPAEPASAAPAATPLTPPTTTPAPRAATAPRSPASPTALTAGQFRTEAEAKAHCPADAVLWVNKETKGTHLAGSRFYGKTKLGAFMCQKDAMAGGFHAPRPPRPAKTTTTPNAPPAPPPASAPAAPSR